MTEIILKKGKDKAAWQLHPWIFSGAIARIVGKPANGDLVSVYNDDREFIAYGYYNGESRVAIRLLEWDPAKEVNENWWRERIQKAVKARNGIFNEQTNTARLIFSEADFLPGLIADRFGDFISLQILTSGIERVKSIVVDELQKLLNPKGIYQREDGAARAHDGLEAQGGVLFGQHPPVFVDIIENGIHYKVNIAEGQKSGFYCDQRTNRLIVAQHAPGKKILDCFCYSGGFSLNALKMGASQVFSVDSSALAIETLIQNINENAFDKSRHKAIQSDVNKQLKAFKEQGEKFDLVILDPPKYAPSRSSLEKASRAYKELNRLGLLLLSSGGLLATFSCSGAMDIDTFKQVLAWAALDAGKEIQFIDQFNQPEDHPIRASFPEGEYLKGLLCRVL
ncbi:MULTISPECIES: class I SAM-dependent rRNA methyltransferase [Olivibacter]|jgi:23S rRNA (cytosine1962-C5)-methyltransferase|uniref:class I SAM-dependent rRNA methyltransferase n=1 Tax=Olivibacter TaxID=376469 RepID=UPI001031128B|nr:MULTISPECIES: class I SAM-dependent rRNA methyltransferase [Olivibacter]QEK99691.1 class I SAM-dependent rRNA methyltransferase [Olivibacter sp. LS-1]